MPFSRLKKRSEFLKASHQGKRVRTNLFTLIYLRLPSTTPSFGFTVSKKVGNAVCRNRIKRRLRTSLQLVLDASSLAALSGYYVFIAKTPLFDEPFDNIKKEIAMGLKKASLEQI